jgi:hypothetical protein
MVAYGASASPNDVAGMDEGRPRDGGGDARRPLISGSWSRGAIAGRCATSACRVIDGNDCRGVGAGCGVDVADAPAGTCEESLGLVGCL